MKSRKKYQLLLADLQKLPLGISIDIYRNQRVYARDIIYSGITCNGDNWYFNNEKMPSIDLWFYGCTEKKNREECNYYIILSDEILRESYEMQRLLQNCIGKKIDVDVSKSEIKRTFFDNKENTSIRIIFPDCAFSGDYNESRVNVYCDKSGVITKLEVG